MYFTTDTMPKSWPMEAVEGLNEHHAKIKVAGRRYNHLLGEYSATLALGVPWATAAARDDENELEVMTECLVIPTELYQSLSL